MQIHGGCTSPSMDLHRLQCLIPTADCSASSVTITSNKVLSVVPVAGIRRTPSRPRSRRPTWRSSSAVPYVNV